jgi:uncharacterized membrane protein
MERSWKAAAIPLIVVVLALAASALFWPSLPDVMPKHWNADGVADGFAPKRIAAWFIPAIMLPWLLLPALTSRLMRLGQLGEREVDSVEDSRLGSMIAAIVMAMLLAIHVAALAKASGIDVDIRRVAMIVVGLAFLPLGNVVMKFRRNAFVGIRTPWAIADDEVWLHTQRFGGRALMVAGMLVAGVGAAGLHPHRLLPHVFVLVFIATMVYSWRSYRTHVIRPQQHSEFMP